MERVSTIARDFRPFGDFSSWRSGEKPLTMQILDPWYPNLAEGQLALVASRAARRAGDKHMSYDQTYQPLANCSVAMAAAREMNNSPHKPGDTVYFVVRGTGDGMAEQVGGWGECAPA